MEKLCADDAIRKLEHLQTILPMVKMALRVHLNHCRSEPGWENSRTVLVHWLEEDVQ